MPWTTEDFRSRHNHGLGDAQAAHASRIANAILASENAKGSKPHGISPEGLAIATANRWAEHHKRAAGGLLPRYQSGGGTMPGAIGGPTPSAMTASPFARNLLMQFGQLPPEQLQEAVMRLQHINPQLAQLAGLVLQQKRMMPQATQQPIQQQAPQAAGVAPPAPPGGVPTLPAQARGGKLPRRQMGGMMTSFSEMNPWWTRSEARDIGYEPSGFLHSPVAGRTDSIRGKPAADSYVIPADVVSGLGEGNSLAGAKFLQMALATGPHGTPKDTVPVRHSRYSMMPLAPRDPELEKGMFDRGGRQGDDRVDCLLAGGEFVVTPEQVRALGGGDVKRGHRILDKFVLGTRKNTIKDMKDLKGPVGAKKE